MALARRHWRFVVRDRYGFVIQNAKVNVYQPGTTTNFLGSAYDAASGGSAISNPLTTNGQGEVEGWFDTEQTVDVQVDDNTDAAYRAVDGASVPTSFTTFVEKSVISLAPENVADVDNIPSVYQTEIDTKSDNPHGAADHTNVTRSFFLPVNDGVVLDGGTLSSLGTAPNSVRTLSCADAATSGMAWAFEVPDDWASGDFTAQLYFVGATTAAGSIRVQYVSKEVSNGEDITGGGVTVAYTSIAPTTANLLVKDTATALTLSPSAVGELCVLNVRRLGADGADNYAAVAHIVGVRITYTANQ